jgi:D-alanyl-D-alanine carboxypeptidase (penicillin-binding protein 5/6)
MKKIISIVLLVSLLLLLTLPSVAENGTKYRAEDIARSNLDLSADSFSVYLCEAKTGKVLYANNEFAAASPASVTKIMTLLLVMEALDAGKFSLTDKVSVSAKAASMGGSQVFLEEGERITVEELIKSAVIASGNDASVALAELTAGSESSFVKMMNQRAAELGLKNTNFENTTGLDDTTKNHYTCAADIAKMSRELIEHELILKYSSMWQDTIRDGEFTLTNTNRLVRYYDGCNGLKTGSTDKAGYCISATAKRENMQLVAVVMGAENRDQRNAIARELLDYGFANYALFERGECFVEETKVLGGVSDKLKLYSTPYSCVIDKNSLNRVELVYEIPENVVAPIEKGQTVGKVIYKINEEQIGISDIIADEDVPRIKYGEILIRILKRMVMGKKTEISS